MLAWCTSGDCQIRALPGSLPCWLRHCVSDIYLDNGDVVVQVEALQHGLPGQVPQKHPGGDQVVRAAGLVDLRAPGAVLEGVREIVHCFLLQGTRM